VSGHRLFSGNANHFQELLNEKLLDCYLHPYVVSAAEYTRRKKVVSAIEPSDADVNAGYMSILQPQRESEPQQEQQL